MPRGRTTVGYAVAVAPTRPLSERKPHAPPLHRPAGRQPVSPLWALDRASRRAADTTGGLREALSQGAARAVDQLGRDGGLPNHPRLRIGLPGPPKEAEPLLCATGRSTRHAARRTGRHDEPGRRGRGARAPGAAGPRDPAADGAGRQGTADRRGRCRHPLLAWRARSWTPDERPRPSPPPAPATATPPPPVGASAGRGGAVVPDHASGDQFMDFIRREAECRQDVAAVLAHAGGAESPPACRRSARRAPRRGRGCGCSRAGRPVRPPPGPRPASAGFQRLPGGVHRAHRHTGGVKAAAPGGHGVAGQCLLDQRLQCPLVVHPRLGVAKRASSRHSGWPSTSQMRAHAAGLPPPTAGPPSAHWNTW